ncbi:MAG: tryptophanase [Thermoplasmata archaeon]|jgi:tryptophanase|nr:tryptophanase [Thermoplasmata archaeon]
MEPLDLPTVPEPYRIKAVERIRRTSREERARLLAAAGYNVFALASDDVYVDLLTDSGVGAMSDRQWAGLMVGDESYAGARSFRHFEAAVKELLGFPRVIPTHQGRGAEHVLCAALVKAGDVVPGNAHFDTTKAHIEHRGGVALDVTIDEASKARSQHPFKGNVDVPKLRAALRDHRGKVPFVLVTVTCNTVGGQPVSLANLREVRAACDEAGVPLVLDIARYAENSLFVKRRERPEMSVRDIARATMDLADAATMSAKKDAYVNIGGFLAVRSTGLFDKVAPYAVLYEGFLTYGGLAGRDLEAMAIGLAEGLDEDTLAHRVGQVHGLGRGLEAAGIPVLTPYGGHAIYVDAAAFLPHLTRAQLPAQALVAELYLEGGVRAVEVGTVMAGRDPASGQDRYPDLELVRLAVPRRTYTQAHLDHVVATAKAVWARRASVKGIRFQAETPILRHFTSTFARTE